MTLGIEAAYFDRLDASVPTDKQSFTAVRELFDQLVLGHSVVLNPAASIRGEWCMVFKGKPPGCVDLPQFSEPDEPEGQVEQPELRGLELLVPGRDPADPAKRSRSQREAWLPTDIPSYPKEATITA